MSPPTPPSFRSDSPAGAISRHKVFVGTITPSGNTVVERVSLAILADFPEVSVHFSRTPVAGSRDPFPDSYDLDGMLGAARLLADAGLAAMVWNGSKAANIGLAHDRALCHDIERLTGVRAGTSMLALDDALRRRGFERIALVSPYAADYQAKSIARLGAEGYSIVADAHGGRSDNLSFAAIPPEEIAAMVRGVASARPSAIVTLCTNFAAAPVVPGLEAELRIPIFDTVALGVWELLRLAGVPRTPGARWGQLFADG